MLTGSDDFAVQTFGSSLPSTHAGAWKRRAWELAIALTNEGHFSWEDLRQALLTEQGGFDAVQDWSQCQRWLRALERASHSAGLVDAGMLAELGQWADRAAALEQL